MPDLDIFEEGREFVLTDELSRAERKDYVPSPQDYIKTKVNMDYIKSPEYARKIQKLGFSDYLSKIITQCAIDILGIKKDTLYEKMIWLSRDGYKELEMDETRDILTIRGNQETDDYLKDNHYLIAIHNHPLNTPPSPLDLVRAYDYEYAPGIILCHNGDLYSYYVWQSVSEADIDRKVKKYMDLGDSQLKAQLKVLDLLTEQKMIVYRKVV